jgi:spore germination protein
MMKVLSSVLALGLIVMGVFLFQSKQNETELNRHLRAQYTERMSDASQKLGELEVAVQKASVFNEPTAQAQPLNDIWRLSSEIKSDIATLPLQRDFSNEWMNYLGRLGDFAKMKSEQKVPEDRWLKVAANVSKNLDEFSNEWQNATTDLLAQKEPYKEWRKQVAAKKPSENWTGLAKNVKNYTESDFPLTASEADVQKKKELKNINEKPITEQQAVKKFKELFPQFKEAKLVTSKSKPGATYPFFHVQFQDGIRMGYADFTVKGGHLLSMLVERPISEERIGPEVIKDNALKAVKSYGFDDVELVESRENHNVWHVTFIRITAENKARVYDDAIQMKLAKDDGEALGISTMEYIQKETLPSQKVVAINWSDFFTKDVKVENEAFAYTDNKELQQRLCYDLLVVKEINKVPQTFQVLVDTETKEVLKTEPLS